MGKEVRMQKWICYRSVIYSCFLLTVNGCCVKTSREASHSQTSAPRFLLTSYSIEDYEANSTGKRLCLSFVNISEEDMLISGTPDGNTWCDYFGVYNGTTPESSSDPTFGMITMHEVGLRPHPWTLVPTRANVNSDQEARLIFFFDTELDCISWDQIEQLSVSIHCIPFSTLSHFSTIRAFESSRLFRESYYHIDLIENGEWCGKGNVYEGRR